MKCQRERKPTKLILFKKNNSNFNTVKYNNNRINLTKKLKDIYTNKKFKLLDIKKVKKYLISKCVDKLSCFMYKFMIVLMSWSKRRQLIRRLLKAKVRQEYETKCEAEEYNTTTTTTTTTTTSSNIDCPIIVDKLRNINSSNCVKLPKDTSKIAKRQFNTLSTPTTPPTTTTINNNNNSKSCGRRTISRLQACCSGGDDNEEEEQQQQQQQQQDIIDKEYSIIENNKFIEERLSRCKDILKNLKDNQLEMLLTSVESSGVDDGRCVFVDQQKLLLKKSEKFDQQDYTRRHKHLHRNNRYHNPLRHNRHSYNTTRQKSKCRHCELRHGDDISSGGVSGESDSVTVVGGGGGGGGGGGSCSSNVVGGISGGIDSNYYDIIDDDNFDNPTTSVDDNIRLKNITTSPISTPANLLSCQVWRWPDLNHLSEIKKMPMCHSTIDSNDVCCNPYHWSRIYQPESPPPPYCLIPTNYTSNNQGAIPTCPKDDILGNTVEQHCRLPDSLAIDNDDNNNDDDDKNKKKEWCTLAYWELKTRVGKLFPVEESAINVFNSLHDGDGLCLSSIAKNHGSSTAVRKTRSKIGPGLILSQEADGIWVYNKSDCSIFVNSPTLNDPDPHSLLVHRVAPGYCLNIFEYSKNSGNYKTSHKNDDNSIGQVPINSVQISFVKGWGPKYSRQNVTSCPCWLEVFVAPYL